MCKDERMMPFTSSSIGFPSTVYWATDFEVEHVKSIWYYSLKYKFPVFYSVTLNLCHSLKSKLSCPVLFSFSQALNDNGTPELILLEPEVLHVLAPPFINRPQAESEMPKRVKRRRSFLRKKREQPSSATATTNQGLVNADWFITPSQDGLFVKSQACYIFHLLFHFLSNSASLFSAILFNVICRWMCARGKGRKWRC